MRGWKFPLAATGALLLVIGWGLHKAGWLSGDSDLPLPPPRAGGVGGGRPSHVKTTDPMDTPSGWRYRQNQPHHWRYIMLQN